MSSPKAERGWLARAWRRTGVRVMAAQAIGVTLAFVVAGVLAGLVEHEGTQRAYRAEVRGELASLDDEWRHKGVAHLAYTVTKRERLWHGFAYGLADAGGHALAGDAGLARAARPGWGEAAAATGRALIYTEALPGGGRLTVGRDLSSEQAETREVAALLALCGLAGVAVCLLTTYATSRWTWRRLDQLSGTAALVAGGRMDVRAPVRKAAAPDEMDEVSLAINAMLDRIGGLIEQLRRVTTDVAHDMRRPLTRLRHKLERLGRAAQATPEVAAEVQRLDADFQEILRTFDALLQLAEIEGSARPEQLIDLTEVAGRVSEALRPDIEESGRSLAARMEPAKVEGDIDLMAQALANLVENALRHTPPGAHIEVSVEAGDGAPIVRVRDNGPGIPAELRGLALAPLGRLEASRTTPGSGLGLAIAASVAQRHGARLALGDAGPGLEVSIAFPPPKPATADA
jgi:signal transduction histidine kinase